MRDHPPEPSLAALNLGRVPANPASYRPFGAGPIPACTLEGQLVLAP